MLQIFKKIGFRICPDFLAKNFWIYPESCPDFWSAPIPIPGLNVDQEFVTTNPKHEFYPNNFINRSGILENILFL